MLNIPNLVQALVEELPFLVKKISFATGLETTKVPDLLVELLRFLEISQLYKPQNLTPSLLVDAAWHEFILFTRTYTRFCQTHFGAYVHHQPDENTQNNQNNFKLTLQCYTKTYTQQPPFLFWGTEKSSAICGLG
jgi:hypothetical protein